MILEESNWEPLPDGTGEQTYYDPGYNLVAFRGLKGRFFLATAVTVHQTGPGGYIDISAFQNNRVGMVPTIEMMAQPWAQILGNTYGYGPDRVRVDITRIIR